MRYFLICTIFFFSQSYAQEIKIISATGQKRYGGIAGSGSSTIYKLDLLVPKRRFKAEGILIKKQLHKDFIRDLRSGLSKDTLIITFYLKDSTEAKTRSFSKINLQYRQGKKRKIFPIDSIKTIPADYMP